MAQSAFSLWAGRWAMASSVEAADPRRGTALWCSASPDLSLRLALASAIEPGSAERPTAESARLAFFRDDWAIARAASMAALVSPLEP
eukprot:15077385-Heterocapsa_arctica.AAC.1